MKVLIIPEDQALDSFIIKPVVEALLEDLNRRARVFVLPEPRLRGASQALDPNMVRAIVADNPMIELFLLVVDCDCNREGNENRARDRAAEHANRLIACVAREEVEVWMLALHDIGVPFADVRKECDPKERYAEPFLAAHGNQGPGGGRKAAMRALKGKWRSLRDRCGELRELQDAIEEWSER